MASKLKIKVNGLVHNVTAGLDTPLLPERHDDPGRRPAGHDRAADRGADPDRDERPPLPVRHVPADPDRNPEGRRGDGEGRHVMSEFSRRAFVKGGGALVVGFGLAGAALTPGRAAAAPDATQVDTWLTVNADNTVTAYPSKHDIGQGLWTGFRQVVAEELDLEVGSVHIPRFDTGGLHPNPDGGRTAGSNGMAQGGRAPRQAAAEARRTLLNLASAQLGVPVASLTVTKGVVSGGGKSVKYGELVAGKLFNTTIQRGATTIAPLKPVGQYKVVGTSPKRFDTPDKVTGKYVYVHNIVVPGMLHGRLVRPPGQGYLAADGASASPPGGGQAVPLSVDESSIRSIPGARVLARGNFIGVVAPTEYAAIQAAAQLRVTWQEADTLPGTGNLYAAMRANAASPRVVVNVGDVDKALASAAKVVSATYV